MLYLWKVIKDFTLHVLRTGVTTKETVLMVVMEGEWSLSLTHTSISWSVVSAERRLPTNVSNKNLFRAAIPKSFSV